MSKHAKAPDAPCPICSRAMPANVLLCSSCRDGLRDDLLDLAGRLPSKTPVRRGETIGAAGLLDELELTRARLGAGGPGVGRVAGKGETSPPFDQRVADVVAELREALENGAIAVLTTAPPASLGSGSPRDLAIYVLRALDYLCKSERVWSVLPPIRTAVRRARGLIDAPPPRLYLGQCGATEDVDGLWHMPCPLNVWAREGEAVVRCDCGAEHSVKDRHRWMLEAAGDQFATLWAIAAASQSEKVDLIGAPVTIGQLDYWRASGRLRPLLGPWLEGREPRRALFSVAEVRVIIDENRQRAEARAAAAARAAARRAEKAATS